MDSLFNMSIILFFLLAIIIGVGVALGRYAYEVVLGYLRYPTYPKYDSKIAKAFWNNRVKPFLITIPYLIRNHTIDYKFVTWKRERLPKLVQRTRHGDDAAIAERLMRVKHIRTHIDYGMKTGEEAYEDVQ